ncbi:MAG: biotin/lipoyl-binding protein, partial [Betaproteobacteria bacterium]|nr:biotin/lipoyl-binding protein [Betaproteobacteria bacterium]
VEVQSSNILNLGLQTMVFTLPVSGNLKALNTVTVKARAAGELLSLFGREGDTVKASQVLAKIDPTEFQRKLRQAEQQADAAKTQIDIAQRQYDNNKALVDQGFISKTALEASEATLAGAKATYNAALAGADVARKTLDETASATHQPECAIGQPQCVGLFETPKHPRAAPRFVWPRPTRTGPSTSIGRTAGICAHRQTRTLCTSAQRFTFEPSGGHAGQTRPRGFR